MARMLSNDICRVTFHDRISDTDITLRFHLPTTEQRVAYANERFRNMKDGQAGPEIGHLRQKYGLEVLDGFDKGAFEKPGPDNKPVLISCDQGDEGYDPSWKEFVRDYASDVVEMLALHVFEVSLAVKQAGSRSPF